MKTLTKNLLAFAVISALSLSASGASACDGMKDHARADDGAKSQAANDSGGKAAGKTEGKTKAGKSRAEDGANKS